MGTSYEVKAYKRLAFFQDKRLKEKIEELLKSTSKSLSTYDEDALLARFNRAEKGRPFRINKDIQVMFSISRKLYHRSGGAWSPTAWNLTKAWGFGTSEGRISPPAKAEIEALLRKSSFNTIRQVSAAEIVKFEEGIRLDFSSIAKGYAVDKIGGLLRAEGYDQFYIEIGGEIQVGNPRFGKKAWHLGIQDPRSGSRMKAIKVFPLANASMATSGGYRQYFEHEGTRYSHIIDPRTGYPVSNDILSVTVLATSCAIADGLATAIMVLGLEKGRLLLRAYPGARAIVFKETSDGTLEESHLP